MKNAPCARFGIRIRPKISEKPDDNRNSRPPKATLFSVWMIQNCHCIDCSLSPADARRVSTHGELGALPLSPASRACPTCAMFKTPQRSQCLLSENPMMPEAQPAHCSRFLAGGEYAEQN